MLRWNHLFEVLSIRKNERRQHCSYMTFKKKLRDGDEEKQEAEAA